MRRLIGIYSLLIAGLFLYSGLGFAGDPPATQTGSHVPKTFRPIDTTRQSTGVFSLKEVVIDGKTGRLPYFTDYKTGRTYEISDKCDDGSEAGRACLKAVNACEDGQVCRIKAEFSEGDHPSILVKKFEVVATETKETSSGAKFTSVNPAELKALGVKDTEAFGESWQLGKVVWGGPARDEKGNIRFMPQRDVKRADGTVIEGAESYCKRIGAELPSREDFELLGIAMGATRKDGKYDYQGYEPQVLPDLTYTEDGKANSRYYWSSSVLPDYTNVAYAFDGRDGYIYNDYRDVANYHLLVRCVVARR